MIEFAEYDKYFDEEETTDFVPASDEEMSEIVDTYLKMGVANVAEFEVYKSMWAVSV